MTRLRLTSLIPLQIVVLLIGIRNIDQPGRVREIAGWMVLAGVLATLVGYALAWRRVARQQGD